MKIFLSSFFVFLSGFSFGSYSDIDPQSNDLSVIIPNMIKEIESHPNLVFVIKNCERINGELLCGEQKVFLQTSPFKCRIIMIDPNLGDQIIYNQETQAEAHYDPIGFPYISMDLDPLGERMRNKNHHSIFELGFGFFKNITAYYYENHPATFRSEMKTINGKRIYTISSHLSFRYKKYVVKKKETPRSLAHRKMISEYLIYEKNNFQNEFNPGDTILIPNNYYKKFELVVDGATFLPSSIKVYDDQGLFEKYTFREIDSNPVFSKEVFNF